MVLSSGVAGIYRNIRENSEGRSSKKYNYLTAPRCVGQVDRTVTPLCRPREREMPHMIRVIILILIRSMSFSLGLCLYSDLLTGLSLRLRLEQMP